MKRKQAADYKQGDTPSAPRKKERFVARTKRRGREAWSLGTTLVREPRAFPAAAGKLFRRSIRTLWTARGGGFYACGFVITFFWLEARTLAVEVSASDGFASFFSEQLFEFLLRFSVQSIANTVQALVWPVFVLERLNGWGLFLLIAGFSSFDKLFKGPLTRWLFSDDADIVVNHSNTVRDNTVRDSHRAQNEDIHRNS